MLQAPLATFTTSHQLTGNKPSASENFPRMANQKPVRKRVRKPVRKSRRQANQEPESQAKPPCTALSPDPQKALLGNRNPLLHLPIELLQLICESLLSPAETMPAGSRDYIPGDPQKELRVNRSALLKFGLTCKAIHGISQGILYGNLTGYHFTSTWQTFRLLIQSLDSNPHLRGRIRSLDFRTHAFDDMEQTLRALPEESVSVMKRIFSRYIRTSWVSGDPLSATNVYHILKYRVQLALLLVHTPDLRRAKVTISIGPNGPKTLNRVTLKSKLSLPRLTELELCPQWDHPGYPFYFSDSLAFLEAATNLGTLILNHCRTFSDQPPLNLSRLQTLIIAGGDMFFSPHSIRYLVQSAPQLKHFQIDFFDHRRDFNVRSKHADGPWHHYFTKVRADGRYKYKAPHQASKRTAAELNFSNAAATQLVEALGPAASTLESIYIGSVSGHLDPLGGNSSQTTPPHPQKPLSSFKSFTALKRLCIDGGMIHLINDDSRDDVLADLIKGCPKFEALMLHGIAYIDMSKHFLRFSEAVKEKMFPGLKKVAILTEWGYAIHPGVLTRGVYERNMAAAGVELMLFTDSRRLLRP